MLELLISGLVIGSVYALFSMSLSLLWGTCTVVNLGHAEILILGAYCMYWIVGSSISWLLLVPLSLVAVFALGTVAFRGLDRALSQAHIEYGSLLVTWGVGLIIVATLNVTVGTDFRSVSLGLAAVSVMGVSTPVANILILVAGAVMAVGFAVLLRSTMAGRRMRAVSENPDLASSLAVNVGAVRRYAFALGITLAFGAGMLLSLSYVFYPTLGRLFILKAVAIVLMAGLGRLGRTWVVGLAVGVAETFVAYWLNSYWAAGFAYGVMVIVLLLRSSLSDGWQRLSGTLRSRDRTRREPYLGVS